MTTSFREKLLQRGKRVDKRVEIDGEEFWLRPPSVAEHTRWQMLFSGDDKGNPTADSYVQMKATLVAMCLVEGEGGVRCFDDSEWSQIAELGPLVEQLYDECRNMLPDMERLVRKAEKNSPEATG